MIDSRFSILTSSWKENASFHFLRTFLRQANVVRWHGSKRSCDFWPSVGLSWIEESTRLRFSTDREVEDLFLSFVSWDGTQSFSALYSSSYR